MLSATTAEQLPILVVDDDSALIRTLSDILRLHGYSPVSAANGRDGIKLAESAPPALAVVDLRLPDMDGMELVSRLHEISAMTEVVVLTGNASLESAVAAMRQNSVDYLLKPVQVDQLLRVAEAATERWQRRVIEEKLRESDERFRAVVESDLLGIMFWDMDGRILDGNDAFLRMIGYTRADLANGNVDWVRMTPPEWKATDDRKQDEMRQNGFIVPYEKEFVRKNGSRVPILIGASSLQRTRERGVGFILDISDRKAAERALEARAAQQQAVAEFGQRAVVSDNMESLFIDACALTSKMLAVPFASVLERQSEGAVLVLRASVGWDPADVGTSFTDAQRGANGFHMATTESDDEPSFEMRGPFPGEAKIKSLGLRSAVTVPIPGAAQSFGVLAAHTVEPRSFTQDDVHFLQAIAHVVGTTVERHRTEAGMRQSSRMEAVGRLAGGVAHDFNNMLTAINGYGELVRTALPEGDPLREDVGEILKASARAAGLTKQLLAFSRQQVLSPRPVNLNDILTQMEGMLRPLIAENIQVERVLAPDLGLAKADPSQVEQVILNLCVNARDAMPDGGRLTIETANVDVDAARGRAHTTTSAGNYVMLAVTDTGSGMDAETKSRVFEPFFTTKGPEKGTGLGLATVYGVVKQSGGEIWVYSELGHGTTFKILLPRTTADRRVESPSAAPSAISGDETVLLVEDEVAVRRLVERMLTHVGYTVLLAADGEEALRVAASHPGEIQLLLTDIIMPVLGGHSLSEKLREVRPGIRTLFLSGYTDATVRREGLLRADDNFLQKPFTRQSLTKRVREVLDAVRPKRR